MSWPLGLSRFIHGFPRVDDGPCTAGAQADAGPISAERQARLLPAVVATLLGCDARLGDWPPTCVAGLLDWADTGGGHRRVREELLLAGLAALDEGLLRTCNLRCEVLSPVLRRHVFDTFARGEMGLSAEAARRFMDIFVEAAVLAFLNFQLAVAAPPDAALRGLRHA